MPPPHRSVRQALGLLLWWSPAWVPLVLAAQLALRGLDPARKERARLLEQAPIVQGRRDDSAARLEHLELVQRAWQDPVYAERYRRSRSPSPR